MFKNNLRSMQYFFVPWFLEKGVFYIRSICSFNFRTLCLINLHMNRRGNKLQTSETELKFKHGFRWTISTWHKAWRHNVKFTFWKDFCSADKYDYWISQGCGQTIRIKITENWHSTHWFFSHVWNVASDQLMIYTALLMASIIHCKSIHTQMTEFCIYEIGYKGNYE